MNLYVNMRSAWKAIKNNRKRSVLTMVGIIIGISSVITILAIGRGFEKDTIKNLTKSDSKDVEIQLNFTPSDTSLYDTNTKFFQDIDLSTIRNVEGVKKADYSKIDEEQIYKDLFIRGNKKNKQIKLIDSEGKKVSIGRNLTGQDSGLLNKVATIDSFTAKELFNTLERALGKGIEIEQELFKVVGVFPGEEQDNLFSLSNTNIEIPEDTYHYYFKSDKNTSSLTLVLKEGVKPDKVTSKVIKQLKDKGSLRHLGEYEVIDTAMLTKGISQILSTITYFITAVAGISLFIAGVGVMNMMYISVSERTKEIGIRRALGATRKSIMLQFLLEGLILTISGGIIGYLLGMIFAYGIGSLIEVHVSVDLFTIILAVGVASVIGLVFSVMPASEAAEKDIIDILR
ncbi:TPA: ABC transporter permease [Enterococcus faecalis]|uniref:ABC transporter permease n=1 Tax=Enterococcus TaxID=1350 RepID=UPI0001B2BA95|nr:MULTISPECIES: ABC transporter permease [Enterococcus]ETJ10745.1 MAG: BacI protein [Enterococcus faecalis DORA_14]HAP3747635.1 FtsX-like permease family protein [Enterococcus faecalis TDR28]HAP3753397.1 FtsX-like permease family protein [Enterococcus faecalis TDR22]HAP3756403.1 FtsX-like permease family protein [Enterococcus faecalis TDR13]HAP3759372.1 FtsX-like permease family protein [Enterococcus faecalis TDR7]HAP3770509.1 FtsX-like permease family protein [Enterococcus faecalis TDR19]H